MARQPAKGGQPAVGERNLRHQTIRMGRLPMLTTGRTRSQQGFTLIELMVVVAIIAVLIAILSLSHRCPRRSICHRARQGFGRQWPMA